MAFEPNRVLLKKANVSGMEIGSPEDFSKEAIDIYSSLLSVHPFTGTRLSYVMKGLLPEMTAAKLLLKIISFWGSANGFELKPQTGSQMQVEYE